MGVLDWPWAAARASLSFGSRIDLGRWSLGYRGGRFSLHRQTMISDSAGFALMTVMGCGFAAWMFWGFYQKGVADRAYQAKIDEEARQERQAHKADAADTDSNEI